MLCNFDLMHYLLHLLSNYVLVPFVAECTPGEAFSILGEKAIFASGSPFHDVDLGTSFIRSPCDSYLYAFLIS